MGTLMTMTALLVIVILSLILGIGAGYLAVMGLLHAFGHRGYKTRTAPATLAPSGTAAGD